MFAKSRTVARLALPLALLAAAGCASSAARDLQEQMDQAAVEYREEIEALKLAAGSSYEREKALADRLQLAEERNAQLAEEMGALRGELEESRAAPPVQAQAPAAPEPATVAPSDAFDALEVYRQALDLYRTRQYDAALGRFSEVIEGAPRGDRADNAQYWIGECHYGLGRWRPALAAFTRVFAYSKTEKADDAQLKIARCYLNLGEKEQALAAFRKLLDEYADSEYAEAARKEMGYLQGP